MWGQMVTRLSLLPQLCSNGEISLRQAGLLTKANGRHECEEDYEAMNQSVCCQCDGRGESVQLYGYLFCDRCYSKLRLHSDKTIARNAELHERSQVDSYENELIRRLQTMERNYAKGRVKLLHILERLSELG